MAKKVSQYTTQATVIASGDLIDLTKLISTGPNVYESQKADSNLLAGWNLFGQDQTMPAPRLHNLGNNQLSLTNGRLLLKGSDNIATDLLKLESLAGTEVFKALNDGTIKISNAFTLPTSDGTTGQALLTNGSGAVSFGNVATTSIYSANDSLTGDRIVDLDGNSLTFNKNYNTNKDFIINSYPYSGAYVTPFFKINRYGGVSISSSDTTLTGNALEIYSGVDSSIKILELGRLGGGTWDGNSRALTFGQNESSTWKFAQKFIDGVIDFTNGASWTDNIHAKFDLKNNNIPKFYFNYLGQGSFVVGSNSAVSTEDISLQGNTLITEKLELSATDHGILLNRVNDAEMTAISATNDEIVYNTQQEGLFRWDGSNWVALAAGFGIVGTTDSTGKPTFYATVKSAYIAGQGSVKLYSDITETSANTIDIVDGRDIDLNGFSYIYDVADSSDVFEATTANNTFRIINGRVIRKNGTAGSYIFNTNNAQTQIDFINIYAENESTTGTNLRTAGTFNAVGSTFVCNNTTGAGVYFNVGSKVTGGKYIQKVNGDNTTLGDELNNVQLICEGSGKSNIRGIVKNSFFVANSGRAIATTALTKIYNSYMYSTSSNAIDLRNGSEVHNSVIISNSSTALGGTAGTETRVVNSTIITESSTGASPVNCPKYLQGCDVISNGNATAIVFPNGQSNAIVSDCRITLTNGASKYGILTNNTSSGIVITNNKIFVNASSNQGIRILSDAYIANNTIKGTSTAINLGANSNLWTASIDSEGNSAQL